MTDSNVWHNGKIRCRNSIENAKVRRCAWLGLTEEAYEDHLTRCLFEEVSCPFENCKARKERRLVDKHLSSGECRWLPVQCDFCTEIHPRIKLKEHLKVCKEFPIFCACGIYLTRTKMESHHDHRKGKCPTTIVPCKYELLGCPFEGVRTNVDKHYELCVQEHLDLALEELMNTKLEINNMKELTKQKHIELTEDHEDDEITSASADSGIHDGHFNDTAATAVHELSQDGTFIWKVHPFEELLDDEVSGSREGIESEEFLTSRYGYKLRLVLHLNGYGKGKGSHLSMYMIIMKGEYDDILSWPFQHKVVFSVLDQSTKYQDRNNYHTVLMDPGSTKTSSKNYPCLEKPVEVENEGYGMDRFISQNRLRSGPYLKNNTVYIKVTIEPVV